MPIVPNRCAIVDDRAEGERRRDAAHDLHQRHHGNIIRRAQRVLVTTALERGTATIDDVRTAINLPNGIDPTVLGAVPTALARAGILRRVGFVETTRPEAHARPVSVWAIGDHGKAVVWLTTHPDLPTPARFAKRDAAGQRLIGWEG